MIRLPALRKCLPALVALLAAIAAGHAAKGQGRSDGRVPLVPESVTLDESARTMIGAEYLTDDERRALRIFHGVWNDSDLTSPAASAIVALNAWDLDHPALSDESTPVDLRAEALLLAGRARDALDLVTRSSSGRAMRLRVQALECLGRYDLAEQAAATAARWLNDEIRTDPELITEAVGAIAIPVAGPDAAGQDYHHLLRVVTRVHQELDRLYWPAMLVEARLLLEKHNLQQAAETLHAVLHLNPRCSDGWYLLGLIALERWDADSALAAAAQLRRINREHPLATLLEAESRLLRDDPEDALDLVDDLLDRYPRLRRAIAVKAAAHGLAYDYAQMESTLDYYDSLSPGSASGYYIAGAHLLRKYRHAVAGDLLGEAARRRPGWSAPPSELGLLAMRVGDDRTAIAHLTSAAELDPFNMRAANTLSLMNELGTYEKIETEHFVLRFRPGVDRVVAELMADELEPTHELASLQFGHEPSVRTLVEMMPDRARVAVRLTGMPGSSPLGACTGPVIVMQTPRKGARHIHYGIFDWPRVLRHEYTHTVTLSQTDFRVPRWLTEGAAQVMESGPRTYSRCRMLASSLRDQMLFDMDEIDWAFIRPRRRGDVGKAYAQGQWMTEFIAERFGTGGVVTLLNCHVKGRKPAEAITAAFGVDQREFFDMFLTWAESQVAQWGLAPRPTMVELEDELRWNDPDLALAMAASQKARLDAIVRMLTEQIGQPRTRHGRRMNARDWPELVRPAVKVSDEQLARWRSKYPDHPDLAELELRRRIDVDGTIDSSLVPLLERYAELRPVDPFPHKKLAQYYLDSGDDAAAVPHLEYLDERVENTTVYALELARIHREVGNAGRALDKMTRVLQVDPYDAPHRELAASLAIEAGRLDLARRHIFALTLLEPDRPRHRTRLERIDAMIADN